MFAIYTGEPGYFGTSPSPDPVHSAKLARRLPLRAEGSGLLTELEPWPPSSSIAVGMYERGALVLHRSLCDHCLRADTHPVTQEMRELFPGGTFIALGLHSVVNYFGYTVVEGDRIRRYGGAEDHLDADYGELLAEEQPHFARSSVQAGMRYFRFPGDEDEYDAPAYGEELVMDLSRRLFGRSLREFEASPVRVFCFQRTPWWKFW